MNKAQLDAALKIAQDKNVRFIDDNGRHLEDLGVFDGFGLPDFQAVHCTIRQVAFLIRWQACTGTGINGEALNEIANAGRHKFIIIGEGSGLTLPNAPAVIDEVAQLLESGQIERFGRAGLEEIANRLRALVE